MSRVFSNVDKVRTRGMLSLRTSRVHIAVLLVCGCLEGCGGGGGGGNGNGNGNGGQPFVDIQFNYASGTSSGTLTIVAGTNGDLDFTVTNSGTKGSTSATTVTVDLSGTFGVSFVSGGGGASGWTCTANGLVGACTNNAAILPGASTGQLVVTLLCATTGCGGPITPMVSNPDDEVPSDNSFTMSISGPVPPNVVISKMHVGSNFTVGSNGQYSIVVTNTGNGPANKVTVTDPLPTGLGFVSGSGANWTCSAAGQVVTCTYGVSLGASGTPGGGAASTLTLTVSVSQSAGQTATNTATVTAQYDTGTANKSSTDIVTVKLPPGSVTVTITTPAVPSITVGTQGTQDFVATLTNDTNNQGVTWSVNGVVGGNSVYGTISPTTTTSGEAAVYSAPSSVPASNNPVTVQATSILNNIANATVSVTIVANSNASLKGQFAFTLHGFQPSGLPVGMIGTFTAAGDASGTLSNILIDSNTATSSNSSTFQSKTAWDGNYSMDSASHGILRLNLHSDSSVTMTLSVELRASGTSGFLAENDTPSGNTASGEFAIQDTSSFDTGAGHASGPWIFRIGRARIGQVTIAAATASTATVSGQEDDNQGNSDTISGGALAIDTDGSGHATLSLPLVTAGVTLNEAVFLVGGSGGDGEMYLLRTAENTGSVQSGSLRFQKVSSGYSDSNAFGASTIVGLIGVNVSGHSAVYVGELSPTPSVPGGLTGNDFQFNDGGTTNRIFPGVTYTLDTSGTGRGTMIWGGYTELDMHAVFYLDAPSEGFVLEVPGGATDENRAGFMYPQTIPSGGFSDATLPGSYIIGTRGATPATELGVAQYELTGTTSISLTDGIEDVSQVGTQAVFGLTFYGDGGTSDPAFGEVNFRIRSTNPLLGTTFMVYFIADNGHSIGVPIDFNIADPQLIFIGQ
jgi:uncharacterized repeat protein (TIGR01451 family)